MPDLIANHEALIRVIIFLTVFTIMALWETLLPARLRRLPRHQRWPANVGMVVINTVILRIMFPTAAVGVAIYAQQHH